MNQLIYPVIFVFGLAIGSFLNCVIYRINRGEGFWKGRSYCPKCRHRLSWRDLMPVFSFLSLAGRCRYCKKPISWQYPLVELGTGIIFALIFNSQFPISNEFSIINSQNLFTFFYYLIISCFLIIIFVSDLRTYTIPDGAVFGAVIVALIFNSQFLISNEFSIFKNSALSGLGAMLFFFLIYAVSRGKWMGFGDVKLAILMGLFLGWPNTIVALFLAFFIGAIMGVGLIIAGRKKMSSEVPFGPFLVLGTFLAFFWGPKIISWYMNFFNI